MSTYRIKPGSLSLEVCLQLCESGQQIELEPESFIGIEASYACLQKLLAQNETIYGVNTGFGLLAREKIDNDALDALQRNLILSHAAGVGEYLPIKTARLILLLKINSLAQGFSGVSPQLINYLVKFYNAEIIPLIPAKGSVGASGDLAPLSHCFLPLLGEGDVSYKGETVSATVALEQAGLSTFQLGPKEGLALLNGTQVSTALCLTALHKAKSCFQQAIELGALSSIAVRANPSAFKSVLHTARKQIGQIEVAEKLDALITQASYQPQRLQDPYSIRCQPQVLGSCLDCLKHVEDILLLECNAVTDNPFVVAESEEVISGGNFHAEPVAFVADYMALALAEMGHISERRVALMIDSNLSGLPAFLADKPGVNSGYMIAHVTSAALVSENKQMASPASVDSISTSGHQEDHVSMATNAANRLHKMLDNVTDILAIELATVCQACLLQPERLWPQWSQELIGSAQFELGLYQDEQQMAARFTWAKKKLWA